MVFLCFNSLPPPFTCTSFAGLENEEDDNLFEQLGIQKSMVETYTEKPMKDAGGNAADADTGETDDARDSAAAAAKTEKAAEAAAAVAVAAAAAKVSKLCLAASWEHVLGGLCLPCVWIHASTSMLVSLCLLCRVMWSNLEESPRPPPTCHWSASFHAN